MIFLWKTKWGYIGEKQNVSFLLQFKCWLSKIGELRPHEPHSMSVVATGVKPRLSEPNLANSPKKSRLALEWLPLCDRSPVL